MVRDFNTGRRIGRDVGATNPALTRRIEEVAYEHLSSVSPDLVEAMAEAIARGATPREIASAAKRQGATLTTALAIENAAHHLVRMSAGGGE
jgi:hypothetical protein